MRDINRIDKFCTELANVWKKCCPDWRFGQLMCNVLGQMGANGRDPFFPEEKEMMNYFRNFFGLDVDDD